MANSAKKPLRIMRADRVPTNPAERERDCIYLVKQPASTEFDIYVVDKNAEIYSGFNEDRFRVLFNQYARNLQVMYVVENIEAMGLLVHEQNSIVYVMDAAGYGDLTGGFAVFFYIMATGNYVLIAKGQNRWDDILGRPESRPAEIDESVRKSHTHENMETLNELSEVGGRLHLRGTPVSTVHFLGGNF